MKVNMGYTLLAITSSIGLFGGMLVLLEVGRRMALGRMAKEGDGAKAGTGPVIGAIFSLLGLLIAFSFSGAASRFDARRQLGVQELNAIAKAYYLLELLPEQPQAALKESFRKYVDAELDIIKKLPDVAAAQQGVLLRSKWQHEIESEAVSTYQDQNSRAPAGLLLPAITQWIEISATRTNAAYTHPPATIFAMLIGLALISSLVAGYAMAEAKSRSWLHIIAFAAVVTVTIYVIVDLEFPRFGLIRLEAADRLLSDFRQNMK